MATTTRRTPPSVLSPPPMARSVPNLPTVMDINNYLSKDLFNYLTDFWKHAYLMWQRSGAYETSEFKIGEVKISAQEANTLIGIDTTKTVQTQLNEKADISSLGSMAFQNDDSVAITGGSIVNVAENNVTINNSNIFDGTIQNAVILAKQGSSGHLMTIGGIVMTSITAVGNLGAGEDNLIQYTLSANTLDNGNAFLEIDAFGTFAGNANNKRVRLYLGSTLLISTALVAANGGSWSIHAKVIRVNINSQKNISTIISDNASVTDGSSYIVSTEDFTTNIIIKCTGQGTANNDVVQEGLIIKMFNR